MFKEYFSQFVYFASHLFTLKRKLSCMTNKNSNLRPLFGDIPACRNSRRLLEIHFCSILKKRKRSISRNCSFILVISINSLKFSIRDSFLPRCIIQFHFSWDFCSMYVSVRSLPRGENHHSFNYNIAIIIAQLISPFSSTQFVASQNEMKHSLI